MPYRTPHPSPRYRQLTHRITRVSSFPGGAHGVVVVLLLGFGVLGWWVLHHGHAGAATEPLAPAKEASNGFTPTQSQWEALHIMPVKRMRFREEQIADGKIALNGDRTTPVYSPYSGRVVKLIAKPGDVVKKDAPLLTIEATEFAQGQNDLMAAIGTLSTARAQEHLAILKEQREQALYQAKGAAKQDWEQSQLDLESARNNRRAAEVALALVKGRLHLLGNSDSEVKALAGAKSMSPDATLPSPIGGTVIDRQASVGQYITNIAGGATTPLYTIGDLSTVWLVANVRESDAPFVQVGDEVEVHVLALPDRVFKAKLSYVASSVDPTTHHLTVRAVMDNRDHVLKPEMSAHFTILGAHANEALAVPESAVVYEGDQAHVWVATNLNALALRNIKVGQVQNGMVEVLDGLNPEDSVVVSGALFIDRAVKSDGS